MKERPFHIFERNGFAATAMSVVSKYTVQQITNHRINNKITKRDLLYSDKSPNLVFFGRYKIQSQMPLSPDKHYHR